MNSIIETEYSGAFEVFNPHRFGHPFINIVANPKDILLFYRKKTYAAKPNLPEVVIDVPQDDILLPLDEFNVQELVTEYLATQSLSVLPEKQLTESVLQFVEKDEKDAIRQ